jgi:GH18 family chitinase
MDALSRIPVAFVSHILVWALVCIFIRCHFQAAYSRQSGTSESGIYDYKALPPAGATVTENKNLVSSYSYSSATKELISYDTPAITKMKAEYIVKKGLAGGTSPAVLENVC